MCRYVDENNFNKLIATLKNFENLASHDSNLKNNFNQIVNRIEKELTDYAKLKSTIDQPILCDIKKDFHLIVNAMSNLIFKVSKSDNGYFMYSYGEGILGKQLNLTTRTIYGKRPEEIHDPEIQQFLIEKYEIAYKGQTLVYDYSYQQYRLLTTLSPVYEKGKVAYLIGCTNDITELYKAREQLENIAYYDSLTGLPNRKKCIEGIEKKIATGKAFALFILDINRFKFVKESLGHSYSNELLRHVTMRLKNLLGDKGQLFRFSEDELIILFDNVTDKDTELLFSYSRDILSIYNEKFQLKNKVDIYMTGNIGISLYPYHAGDFESLLKKADTALGAAKKLGKNVYEFYDEAMSKRIEKNLQIEAYLQTAIRHNELELYFQPKLDVRLNKINSMEALLRWHHPVLGTVPPGVFIPIAEETGVISQIDEWVLEKACRQNKIWNQRRKKPLRIAVNISAIHFCHPDFVAMVKKVLDKTGLKPSLLELEITETTIFDHPDECICNVKKLRNLGITVSIDDFGTGFTSLNYLRKYSFDYLKIDRSYVKEIMESKETFAIIKAIIFLAHELNLKVVAEGVEEKQTLDYLIDIGCDEIQGYYISKPVPVPEFEKFIEKE